jgi:TolA-binding protein
MPMLMMLCSSFSDSNTRGVTGMAQDAKVTIINVEDLVVDLSTELVEKYLQTEQMGTLIHELEEQVDEWSHTIEVLENQLQNTQQHLEEANEHLFMHH